MDRSTLLGAWRAAFSHDSWATGGCPALPPCGRAGRGHGRAGAAATVSAEHEPQPALKSDDGTTDTRTAPITDDGTTDTRTDSPITDDGTTDTRTGPITAADLATVNRTAFTYEGSWSWLQLAPANASANLGC